MSTEQQEALPTGAPRSTLVAGAISVATIIIYLLTSAGITMLCTATATGIAGIVFGILAIRKRQFVGVAVTGLVLGSLGFLAGAGLLLFMLAFVGLI